MSKQKIKIKSYNAKYSIFITVMLLVAIAYVVVIVNLFTDENLKFALTVVLIPVLTLMINKFITFILDSRATVDIKIYHYKKLSQMNVDIVWISPYSKKNPPLSLAYIEVQNIGITLINKIEITIQSTKEMKSATYIIVFPCNSNDKIYLAVPVLPEDMSNVSIIYHSQGADKAKIFSGDLIETDEYKTFSQIFLSRYIKPEKNNTVDCVRIALKQTRQEHKKQSVVNIHETQIQNPSLPNRRGQRGRRPVHWPK